MLSTKIMNGSRVAAIRLTFGMHAELDSARDRYGA